MSDEAKKEEIPVSSHDGHTVYMGPVTVGPPLPREDRELTAHEVATGHPPGCEDDAPADERTYLGSSHLTNEQYWAERTEPEVIDGTWCPATVCARCQKRFPPYMAAYRAADVCSCDRESGPHAELLAELDDAVKWPGHSRDWQALARDAAQALRARIDEAKRSDKVKTGWFHTAAERGREIRKLKIELAEARAAAPEVLWSGQWQELSYRNLHSWNLSPGTRVSVIRDTEAKKEGE